MPECLNKIVIENMAVISSFLLTMEVLGFSIFASIHSNLRHNSETADINEYSYKCQADVSSTKEASIYQGIAKKWRDLSNVSRRTAKLRAYSAIFCWWGLILVVISLILAFLDQTLPWLIFLVISLVLFISACVIYFKNSDCSWIEKAHRILRGGIDP